MHHSSVRNCGARKSKNVSLHRNQINKQRWLNALEIENINLKHKTLYICWQHFNENLINKTLEVVRLKDDAVPTIFSPAVSSFNDSKPGTSIGSTTVNKITLPINMELCRICLRSKGKMFSLQIEPLKSCFGAIVTSLDDEVGLPQSVCYICSRQLEKCYSLIRRTRIAKSTLLNICSRYGGSDFNALKITKDNAIMKEINKVKSNLSSKLKTIQLTKISINGDVTNHLINTSKDSYKISHSSNIDSFQSDDLDYICDDFKIEEVYTRDHMVNSEQYPIKEDLTDQIETDDFIDNTDSNKKSVFIEIEQPIDDDGVDKDDIPLSVVKMECDVEESSLNEPEEQAKQKDMKQRVQRRKRKKAVLNSEGLTKEEVELKQYFDIIILSVEEQIAERLKMKETTTYRDALYRCEICYRTYLNPQAHQTHLQAHSESHGEWECSVCKMRFKAASTMLLHADKSHGKKYCCKACPKTFTKLELAAKHSKRHTGYVYKCSMCEHTAANKSVLKNHLRNTHNVGGSVCSICGQTFANIRGLKLHTFRQHNVRLLSEQQESFECHECELSFPTADALATHTQMSHIHTDNAILICSTCGEEFPSQNELNKHSKLIHGDEIKWGLPGDTYPTKCEHCGIQLNNRKEHYFHVRKIHPKERDKYQAVITAVCITCGKGFQNATKLHLHELRHKGVLSVRCPHAHCPRLFYDKFHLARHVAVHSDERPFACAHCDKTFKLRSNLDRHAKVHSDVTAYECSLCNKRFRYSSSRNLHIKTVHYKMPQPPRKRKTAKSNKALNSFDECMQ